MACRLGSPEIVATLLKHGATPNYEALVFACTSRHQDRRDVIVNSLLAARAPPDATAEDLACLTECAKSRAQLAADDEESLRPLTPLAMCCSYGFISTARILLSPAPARPPAAHELTCGYVHTADNRPANKTPRMQMAARWPPG